MVYYRAGYVPIDYASPADYTTRAVLESSHAIQCPSIALQLAGAKKVQEVLSRPGVLERFLAPSEGADAVRDSWVSMWSLDRDDGKGAEEAVRRAHELVLKPQREGGGNNIYRGNIPPFVAQMSQPERVAWVAMELIRPPRGVGAYLIRPGTGRVKARVMSELGVFGWALFGEGREVREEQVGWLVRTKAEDVDEGWESLLGSVCWIVSYWWIRKGSPAYLQRRRLSPRSTVNVVYTAVFGYQEDGTIHVATGDSTYCRTCGVTQHKKFLRTIFLLYFVRGLARRI